MALLPLLLAAVAQANLLDTPIGTGAPPDLFPRIDHPQPPTNMDAAAAAGAIPTNKFWGNLVYGNGENPIYVQPYVFRRNTDENTPFGLRFYGDFRKAPGGESFPGVNQYYWNEADTQVVMATPGLTAASVTSFDNAAVELTFTGSAGSVSFPIVRGAPYVTGEFSVGQPILAFNRPITNVDGVAPGGTVTGSRLRVTVSGGQEWLVYVFPGDLAFTVESDRIVATLTTFTGVLRAALLPGGADEAACAATLDEHAPTFPVGMTVDAALNTLDASAAAYAFEWQYETFDDSVPVLSYALPHHQDILAPSSAEPSECRLPTTTKGISRAYSGNTWVLREPELIPIEWLPDRTIDADTLATITAQLRSDVEGTWDAPSGSNYFEGKRLHKYALLCLVAEELLPDVLTTCVDKLEAELDVTIENRQGNPYQYDETWRGLVGIQGLSGDPIADFGGSWYNDRHYHSSYTVYAAAILIKLRPAWQASGDAWIRAVLRDVANPTPDADTYFPEFRSFDWWSGHSWSQGLFESAEGKDQESTSEEVLFLVAMALYGKVVDDSEIEHRAQLMLTVASRSINEYFLMRADNPHHPPTFIGNKVTGIFFQNKADHTTWFSPDNEAIHGIQMIPAVPVTEYVRYSDFVDEEWDVIGNEMQGVTNPWRSIVFMNYAMVDRDAAFEVLLTAPLDDGLMRAWALYWIATRADPGTITRPALPTSEAGYLAPFGLDDTVGDDDDDDVVGDDDDDDVVGDDDDDVVGDDDDDDVVGDDDDDVVGDDDDDDTPIGDADLFLTADLALSAQSPAGPPSEVSVPVPNNGEVVFTIDRLTGAVAQGQQTEFSLWVDAQAIATGIQAAVSYDFDGDGSEDRRETYPYFAIDAAFGVAEEYARGDRVPTIAGSDFVAMSGGSVSLVLSNAIGSAETTVEVDGRSYLNVPFDLVAGGDDDDDDDDEVGDDDDDDVVGDDDDADDDDDVVGDDDDADDDDDVVGDDDDDDDDDDSVDGDDDDDDDDSVNIGSGASSLAISSFLTVALLVVA